jgi:hypothetical protein
MQCRSVRARSPSPTTRFYRAMAVSALAHRPVRLVSVALANNLARLAWALMTRKEVYQVKERRMAASQAVR